jgi:hypothetical protein
MAYSDIARAMGFPDPTEVRTASGKIGMETDQARAYLKMLADDARQRKAAADTAQDKADTDQESYSETGGVVSPTHPGRTLEDSRGSWPGRIRQD